ncbi:MAG: hypothetical protein P8N47_00770 [Bacteroidia bacterium]|jgi:uncharacterized protein YyaL (SSP411 family)|nr:hypothetical protein [Bacteroidia bacterium]
MFTYPYYEVIVVGPEGASIAKKLQNSDLTNCIVVFSTQESNLPMFRNRYVKGQTTIYVCQQGACQLPVYSVTEALKLIS